MYVCIYIYIYIYICSGGQPVEGDEVPNVFARSCIAPELKKTPQTAAPLLCLVAD